ncbi:hypothetical protein [Laspinema palackyanum]
MQRRRGWFSSVGDRVRWELSDRLKGRGHFFPEKQDPSVLG